MPLFIDDEVVDEHRFSWCGGSHSKSLTSRKHVDKAAFPTLLRPIKAYSGSVVLGHISARLLLMRNSADVIFIGTAFVDVWVVVTSIAKKMPEKNTHKITPFSP